MNGQTRDASASRRKRRVGKRILFVTPELADFVKVGGLGDVSAALPRALSEGHDVRVLIPGYRQVLAQVPSLSLVGILPAHAALPAADLAKFETPDGLSVYVILCPTLYDRDGSPYLDQDGNDFDDNDMRFARLCLAAADIAAGEADPEWSADVVHANDWPTALTPGYLRWRGMDTPSIITIHNLSYQGVFERERLGRLGIPDDAFRIDGVEFHNQLSFLKAGIFYSTHVTTVSRTYAQEITTPEKGCGLDGLLRAKAEQQRLTGILNGVDEQWDPRTDNNLFRNFGPGDWRGKRANSDNLRAQFGLAVSRGPLFGVVSRLVHQKGIDLVISAAEMIAEAGGQVVVTGQGEKPLENALVDLASRYPEQVGARIGFDEAEARNIFAASDFLLMPSRFEPCGLSQMYAQRFGALPVAHRIGGLADTIEDGRTGFLFREHSLSSFCSAIGRALTTFGSTRRLNEMRAQAMTSVAGWDRSANDYNDLYMRVCGNRAAA